MRHGTYIGEGQPDLRGKSALLILTRVDGKNVVKAQFDDRTTGLGFGWHYFDIDDWMFHAEQFKTDNDNETEDKN